MSTLKQTTAAKTINALLPLVSRASDQDIERILWILERMAPEGAGGKDLVHTAQQQWKEDRPSAQLVRRLLRELNPHCRERFVADFILNNAWGPAAARREALIREEELRAPVTFLISPSMRCNLRCVGCYAGDYSVKDDLPFEVIDRVLSEGEEMGIYFVTVLGGEPFIRHDMWEIYERHSDVIFQVFTNGTLLDDAAVGRLAELGNVVPVISIEGFEEETDARRGKGTYQKIMQATDRLHRAGVLFGFSSMVTRHNVETIISDEFNDMLVAKGVFFGWHFLYMPVGRNPDLDLMPTPQQRERLRVEGAQRIRNTKPLFVADFWNDAPYVGGCIAGGRDYFHINSRGDVEPCIFAHFAVDNIKERSLKEVLRSPLFVAIRRRQPYSDNLLRPCMIIDHPWVLREIYEEVHPYPTDSGALSLVNGLAPGLDRYAEEQTPILGRAWQESFVARGFCPPPKPLVPEPRHAAPEAASMEQMEKVGTRK